MTQSALQRHTYDVLVIGAGGAGLRAAVEAREAGLSVAIICKSLFGKAYCDGRRWRCCINGKCQRQ